MDHRLRQRFNAFSAQKIFEIVIPQQLAERFCDE
jgi:hypothetical protein